jgi:hypothetical protein
MFAERNATRKTTAVKKTCPRKTLELDICVAEFGEGTL